MEKKEIENFISLSQASNYSGYSPEYLNLRIRQGKLKAVKFGRNWMTKKEWIDDYVFFEKDREAKFQKQQEKYLKQRKTILRKIITVRKRLSLPENYFKKCFFEKQFIKKREKSLVFQFSLLLLIFSIVFGFGFYILYTAYSEKVFLEEAVKQAQTTFSYLKDKQKWAAFIVQNGIESLNQEGRKQITSLNNIIPEVLKEYNKWAKEKISLAWNKTKQGFKNFLLALNKELKFWKKEKIAEKETEEQVIPEIGTKQGTIVFPTKDFDSVSKEKIEKSFSDEVEIKPEDKSSGLIIPIFKEKPGPEYMYVLVPIKEKEREK